MPQSESSKRDRVPERLGSVRDRLELIDLVLRELDFLRQRQELLVRTALQEEEEVQEAQLDSEENILVLNRLRRRDAALITQLHQLDQQIQELQLDPETSHHPLEPDSRPSSGFYELSDGTSASLSNSSHSVFSEGFCSAADSEGPLPLKEKPDRSLDWDVLFGGLCGNSTSSPHQSCLDPAPLLVPKEFQSKPFSGLRAQSYLYQVPTPFHPVVVQDPGFPLTRDGDDTEPETSPLVPQNSSIQIHSNKHLDRYISSLLQRRSQPIRTSRPRTSFNTDPSKNILRQTGLYGRQVSGPDSGLGTPKSSFHPGGTSAEFGPVLSSQRQSEDQNLSPGLGVNSSDSSSSGGCHPRNSGSVSIWDSNTKRDKGPSSHSAVVLLKDFRNQGSPSAKSTHKNPRQPCCDRELDPESSLMGEDLGSSWENHPGRTWIGSSRNGSQLLQSGPAKNPEKPVPQNSSLGASTKNPTGGGRDGPGSDGGNSWYLTAKQQNLKSYRGNSKNIKTSKTALRTLLVPEDNELPLEKSSHKSGSRTALRLEDGGLVHIKTPHKGKALRKKNISASVSERRGPDKYSKSSSVQSGGSRPHRHRIHCHYNHRRMSNQTKSKREDHRRLHVISEVPSDRGTKRVLQQQRPLHPHSGGQKTSPYSYGTGTDSEYSAECLSLFHSTIVDTSEDETSNYTTNCFGDSESSEEVSVEEDLEESVGGGPVVRGTGGWRRPGPKQDCLLGHTKTLVKIKASHNLKKKILRSRSGSLKLMTTV